MKLRTHAVAALLVVGTACSGPGDEPAPTVGDRSALAQQPVSSAQATSGKPLIHVWKSPT
jgi:hypothetical protein